MELQTRFRILALSILVIHKPIRFFAHTTQRVVFSFVVAHLVAFWLGMQTRKLYNRAFLSRRSPFMKRTYQPSVVRRKRARLSRPHAHQGRACGDPRASCQGPSWPGGLIADIAAEWPVNSISPAASPAAVGRIHRGLRSAPCAARCLVRSPLPAWRDRFCTPRPSDSQAQCRAVGDAQLLPTAGPRACRQRRAELPVLDLVLRLAKPAPPASHDALGPSLREDFDKLLKRLPR